MMTLEQAIEHAREIAEEYEEYSKGSDYIADDCKECAKEHRQLEAWLTELKDRREYDELDLVFKSEGAQYEEIELPEVDFDPHKTPVGARLDAGLYD